MGKKEEMETFPIYKIIVNKLQIKGNLDELVEIAVLICSEKKYLDKFSRDQKRKKENALKWFQFNFNDVIEPINRIQVIGNKFVLPKKDCQAALQEENNETLLQKENSPPPLYDVNENSNNLEDILIDLSSSSNSILSEHDYFNSPYDDPNFPYDDPNFPYGDPNFPYGDPNFPYGDPNFSYYDPNSTYFGDNFSQH